jgi:hypothetical protein
MRNVEVGSSPLPASVGWLTTVGLAQLDTGRSGSVGASPAGLAGASSSGASVPASVIRNVDTGSAAGTAGLEVEAPVAAPLSGVPESSASAPLAAAVAPLVSAAASPPVDEGSVDEGCVAAGSADVGPVEEVASGAASAAAVAGPSKGSVAATPASETCSVHRLPSK